ncbi:hypothetical protein F5X96DRAFT_431717 [Biscogniauxia mediterranea]|nr:hypothetical protein F5X96DRAFT_431717 [Biscogniauxia mediterranea]
MWWVATLLSEFEMAITLGLCLVRKRDYLSRFGLSARRHWVVSIYTRGPSESSALQWTGLTAAESGVKYASRASDSQSDKVCVRDPRATQQCSALG